MPPTACPNFFEMLGIIWQNHGKLINELLPLDKDGMRLTPVPGVTPVALETAIDADLSANHWICTSTHSSDVLIEPEYTRPLNWSESNFHFHVADFGNRPKILANGLALGIGGNTTLQRKYPPRIYITRDLLGALEFVRFQCKTGASTAHLHSLAAKGVVPKTPGSLDIWRVELASGTPVYADPLFPCVGGWVDAAIPATSLQLVTTWQTFETQWANNRKNGSV